MGDRWQSAAAVSLFGVLWKTKGASRRPSSFSEQCLWTTRIPAGADRQNRSYFHGFRTQQRHRRQRAGFLLVHHETGFQPRHRMVEKDKEFELANTPQLHRYDG